MFLTDASESGFNHILKVNVNHMTCVNHENSVNLKRLILEDETDDIEAVVPSAV